MCSSANTNDPPFRAGVCMHSNGVTWKITNVIGNTINFLIIRGKQLPRFSHHTRCKLHSIITIAQENDVWEGWTDESTDATAN